MIYYLAHPWKQNPNVSFLHAVKWTMILRENGFEVFSPILHTHPYWEILKDDTHPGIETLEAETYLNHEKWLPWDLAIMGGFKHVTVLLSRTAYNVTPAFHNSIEETWNECSKAWDDLSKKYWANRWLSDGCRQEYEFAKQHHIRVLVLEDFLEGKEVEL